MVFYPPPSLLRAPAPPVASRKEDRPHPLYCQSRSSWGGPLSNASRTGQQDGPNSLLRSHLSRVRERVPVQCHRLNTPLLTVLPLLLPCVGPQSVKRPRLRMTVTPVPVPDDVIHRQTGEPGERGACKDRPSISGVTVRYKSRASSYEQPRTNIRPGPRHQRRNSPDSIRAWLAARCCPLPRPPSPHEKK